MSNCEVTKERLLLKGKAIVSGWVTIMFIAAYLVALARLLQLWYRNDGLTLIQLVKTNWQLCFATLLFWFAWQLASHIHEVAKTEYEETA